MMSSSWQRVLAHLLNDVEVPFDSIKYRLGERFGHHEPIMILPYRSYGRPDRLYVKGRVLEDKGITPAAETDTLWVNLVNMYRRFQSDEVPGARVRIRFAGSEQEVVADDEGYFEAWLTPPVPLSGDDLWQRVDYELVSPLRGEAEPAQAQGDVMVPPPTARFAVISDIDDTVVRTDATSALQMARNVFLNNARTRLPFPGVAAFYRALYWGASGNERNPLFYVSSGPWNLYDLLSDFFALNQIPGGPVLLLRDWGLTRDEVLPLANRDYKLAAIRRILDFYPKTPFLLLGDSGQEDPEIYQEIVADYPRRVLAVYIRNVSRHAARSEQVKTLAGKVLQAGSTLILADTTLPLADHAAAQGWIASSTLASIQAEKQVDTAPAESVEDLLKG